MEDWLMCQHCTVGDASLMARTAVPNKEVQGSAQPEDDATQQHTRYSVYLRRNSTHSRLYWYKSTNTDTARVPAAHQPTCLLKTLSTSIREKKITLILQVREIEKEYINIHTHSCVNA
jgi:hypothetical protein